MFGKKLKKGIKYTKLISIKESDYYNVLNFLDTLDRNKKIEIDKNLIFYFIGKGIIRVSNKDIHTLKINKEIINKLEKMTNN